MLEIGLVSAVPGIDTGRSAAAASTRLERLLRRQRTLAWVLSIGTFALTVTFFGAMTLAAPLLKQVVIGRSITLANVAGVSMIALFLISIAVFGWHASQVDDELRDARSGR
jgi:uncharacterized membrane protein (DUF485 family)